MLTVSHVFFVFFFNVSCRLKVLWERERKRLKTGPVREARDSQRQDLELSFGC